MGNICAGAESQTRESLAQTYRNEALGGARSPRFYQHYKQPNAALAFDPMTGKLNQHNHYHMRGGDTRSTAAMTTNNVDMDGNYRRGCEDHGGRIQTRYTYGNGDHYEGHVLAERRDIRDGQGIFYCSNKNKRTNYEYHGEWRYNLREGKGHCYYYNEDLYVG